MLHTLHHPALRRALGGGDVGDFQIPAKDLRPLRRVIDSADGTVPWEEFRDDTDQRLTDLVQSKLRPTKRRRASRSSAKPRSTAARAGSSTTRKRRKAA